MNPAAVHYAQLTPSRPLPPFGLSGQTMNAEIFEQSEPLEAVFGHRLVVTTRISGTSTPGLELRFENLAFGRESVPWRHAIASSSASSLLASAEYHATLDQIEELANDEDEEERPTDHALEAGRLLVRDAGGKLGQSFPRALAATGPNRCLRLQWSMHGRVLRLVVGGGTVNKTYLYWENEGHHGINCNVNGDRLTELLCWLSAGM